VAIGFVLVTTAAGQEKPVHDAASRLAGVVEVVPLFGEYDLLVKVEAGDWDALGRIILHHLRTLPGVSATKTLAAARL
jgi:DNA-binding Lrp family transcriptional regulator